MMNEKEFFGVFGALLIHKDKLYSFSNEYNLLLIFNNSSRVLEDVKMLPDEPINGEKLISRMNVWKDRVVLIPNNAPNVYIFDNDKFRVIRLEQLVDPQLNNKFGNSFVYDDFLCLVGHMAPMILVIDLVKESVVYKYDVPDEFRRLRQKANDAFFKGCFIKSQKLYLPFVSGGYLAEFNTSTYKVNWTLIDENDSGYSEVSSFGDFFLLFHRRGGGATVVKDKKKIKTIYNDLDFYYVSRIIKYKSGFLSSFYDGALYYLDFEKENYSLVYDVKCYGVSNIFDSSVYLLEKNIIEQIDIKNLKRKQVHFELSELNTLIDRNINNCESILNGSMLNEDGIVSLRTFLRHCNCVL